MKLLNGKVHYRCYLTERPIDGEWKLDETYKKLCRENAQCPDNSFCGSRFEAYNDDGTPYLFIDTNLWVDTEISELNYGITNFDDISSAFLTIFVVTTMDSWSHIMVMYEDVFNEQFVKIYFIFCVIICSFFILNLTIALMLVQYDIVS